MRLLGLDVKNSVRLTAISSVFILGLASAQAADPTIEPAPAVQDPAYDWTGPYIGVHGGIGGGEFDNSYRIPSEVDLLRYDVGDRAFGAFGGAQIGYNYQFAPNWVAGVEADFSASGIKAEHSESSPWGGLSYAIQIDWFGTLRGRVGYAWDNVLFYGTGGGAYGKIAYSEDDSGGLNEELSETNWGWTAGAGVEYGITRNVTLKTEYLYVDLGSLKATDFLFAGDKTESQAAIHTLKAGLNIKF